MDYLGGRGSGFTGAGGGPDSTLDADPTAPKRASGLADWYRTTFPKGLPTGGQPLGGSPPPSVARMAPPGLPGARGGMTTPGTTAAQALQRLLQTAPPRLQAPHGAGDSRMQLLLRLLSGA